MNLKNSSHKMFAHLPVLGERLLTLKIPQIESQHVVAHPVQEMDLFQAQPELSTQVSKTVL